MAVHIFGGAVGNDVGSPFKGAAVDGRGKRVVHNEGHAVAVCNLGKTLNVEYVAAGVGDGLSEDALGVGAEGCLNLLVGGVGIDESALYA